MPELSPRLLTIWLLIAAVVLFVGARALHGQPATKIDPGPSGAAGLAVRGDGGGDDPPAADSGRLELVEDAGRRSGEPVLHVHVAGAVRRPGLYRLRAGSRVADALRRAGDAKRAADLDRINLAATLSDGQQVLVPRRGEPPTAIADAGSGADPGESAAPISLASATAAELETIDGIGPVTAEKILTFRDSEGGIESVEELDAIPGIGPATMQTLRQALVP